MCFYRNLGLATAAAPTQTGGIGFKAGLDGSQTISSLPTSTVQQQGQYPSLKDIF